MHDTMHGIYSRRDKQTTHTPVSGHTKAHKQSRAHQRGERTDRPRGTHVGQVSPTYGPVLRELADLLVAPVRGYQFHEILSIIINHVQCVFSKQHRHRYRPTQLSNSFTKNLFADGPKVVRPARRQRRPKRRAAHNDLGAAARHGTLGSRSGVESR